MFGNLIGLDAGRLFGVFHENVNQQREENAARNVPVIAAFHASLFKPERKIFGGAAKNGNRKRVRQTHAQGPDFRRKQFGLYHRIYGSITTYDQQSCQQ